MGGTLAFEGDLVVTLPIGSNLPWMAALAGGLPAAAGAYVASRIFESQLGKFSSAIYKVSGRLEDPQIEFQKVFDTEDAAHGEAPGGHWRITVQDTGIGLTVTRGLVSLMGGQIRVSSALGRGSVFDYPDVLNQPPADVSSMDGYAVRFADMAMNAELRVVGESRAGVPWSGKIGARQAVRIFTEEGIATQLVAVYPPPSALQVRRVEAEAGEKKTADAAEKSLRELTKQLASGLRKKED